MSAADATPCWTARLSTSDPSERALILAPLGRDALVADRMLTEAGLTSRTCSDIAALRRELEVGAGFAVVTEEALGTADVHELAAWIDAQPAWSDFPFVLLTHRGGGLERNPRAAHYLGMLGNVTFIERPFHPTTSGPASPRPPYAGGVANMRRAIGWSYYAKASSSSAPWRTRSPPCAGARARTARSSGTTNDGMITPARRRTR